MSQVSGQPNVLLLTYDSCRYDVLKEADTPVLDSFVELLPAQAPANFTYPSHQAMFSGVLPNCDQARPYYNRFCGQLLALMEVGETQVVKGALIGVQSSSNLVTGLGDRGYQTVGAGAMTWFRQSSLTGCFDSFLFTGTAADDQIGYLLETLRPDQPFFGFINFGETHAPFDYAGKAEPCPVDVRARRMEWPPARDSGPVGRDSPAFAHQMAAAEYLDTRLPRLFAGLPADTIVIVCGDHGECFGEDGYWGHGVNHAKVLEVPLGIFRLDGRPLGPNGDAGSEAVGEASS